MREKRDNSVNFYSKFKRQVVVNLSFFPVPEATYNGDNGTENYLDPNNIKNEIIHANLHLGLFESDFLGIHHKLCVISSEQYKPHNPLSILQP
jgi:hypothetical protein